MKSEREKLKDKTSRIEGGTLTKEERIALGSFIQKKKLGRTQKQKLRDELLSFQEEILRYLYDDKQQYRPVGDFLEEYIQIAGVKKSDFAKQLDIHTTKLSNLLKDRVRLNPLLAYKLEAHSAMIIGVGVSIIALYWIRLQQKDELIQIMNEPSLKEHAYKTVESGLKNK